jgi:GNAT superfamily N-acetyltransferase
MNRALHRGTYAQDPDLLRRVFALLDSAFPGLSGRVRGLAPSGLRWDRVSTPFVVSERGRLVAHVGVLEVPMVLDGCETLVGGMHAVCTHPEFRGRGYFRRAMNAALAWCDERYGTVALIGGPPELYAPFGFRVVPESRFVGPVLRSSPSPERPRLRRVALDQVGDRRLLDRLLDERAQVSRRLGVVRERSVFLFTQAREPMWYAEDLDAILCLEIADGTLRLYDIVATRVPALEQVVDRIDAPLNRVEVYFTPDQLGAPLAAEPHVVDGDSWLLARGPFASVEGGLMLPRTIRF